MKRISQALILGVLVLGSYALAQTPDGMTPSEETVCDELEGAAFGLCNAYCEAMDCDGDPQASSVACDKVQDNYFKIVGADPPCLARCGIGTGPGGINEFPICSPQCSPIGACVYIEETFPVCETQCGKTL